VLLLGNAGGRHDGAYLTDTIMVASFDPKDKQTYFISLPRDMWLDEYKYKMNALYEMGEEKEEGSGLSFSKEAISKILGIPIHHAIRIDFRGFVQAVDEVDGIEVNVIKSFEDSLYPIEGKEDDLCGFKEEEKEFNPDEAKALNIEPGKRKVLIAPDSKIATDSADPKKGYEYFACRFEKISFKAGPAQMDGETALKFVRSRMGTNGEGSDFARSRRQQQVIEAFRSKLLSFETLVNPAKIAGLIDAFGRSFETDVPINDMIRLYNLSKESEASHSYVLSNVGAEALLVNPPTGPYGAWVLVPKDPTYNQIHAWVQSILRGEEQLREATSSARPSPR
jgi:LCP family protein required for cell wall assembly